MPDATGLELLAQELASEGAEALGTLYFRGHATSESSRPQIRAVLATLRERDTRS